MANFLFRILLTFNATSLLLIIYCIQKKVTLHDLFPIRATCQLPDYASYFAYALIPIVLTAVSIKLSSCLGKDEFKLGTVKNIEHANNSFLPSYLGYFFVALSISDGETLAFVYSILFIFTLLSQALYFNPLFLLFRYEFYNVTTVSGATLFLISRERYKVPDKICIESARRINDYTYIERK